MFKDRLRGKKRGYSTKVESMSNTKMDETATYANAAL